MFDLAEHFSSRAKIKTLEVLCHHASPLPLRHVAYLSNLQLFSIQRALADLQKSGVVLCRKRKRSTLYSLNRQHPDLPLLCAVFRLIDEETLKMRAATYQSSARNALAFASEAREMYDTVKRKTHDA